VIIIDGDGGVDDLLCLVMASRLVAKEIARTSFCGNRIALRSGTRPSVRHLTSMRMLLKDAHYSRLPPVPLSILGENGMHSMSGECVNLIACSEMSGPVTLNDRQ